MAAVTKREKIASQSLYQIGYKYLCDNFHKFKQAQKIRVAISILQIFEKDDSKTPLNPTVAVTVEIVNENKTPQESGNRISEYVQI